MSPTRTARGFTLVEFILALLVGMLVIIGVLALYYERTQILNGQRTVTAIQTLQETANNGYPNSSGFTTQADGAGTVASMGELLTISGGVLPEGVVESDGTYKNRWGGGFSVSVESTDGVPGVHNDLLVIELNAIPPGPCAAMVGKLAAAMYDTTVNGALVGLAPEATVEATNRNEVRYDQMMPLCTAGESNTIRFRALKEFHYASLRAHPFMNTFNATEAALIQPHYARIEAALANREAEQVALP